MIYVTYEEVVVDNNNNNVYFYIAPVQQIHAHGTVQW